MLEKCIEDCVLGSVKVSAEVEIYNLYFTFENLFQLHKKNGIVDIEN